MSIKDIWKVATIVLLVALFFTYRGCESYKDKFNISQDELLIEREYFRSHTNELERSVDDLGLQITTQKQLIVSQEAALNSQIEEFKNFKSIVSHTKVITETKIDSIPVEYAVFDTVPDPNKISVPKTFNHKQKWFGLSGTIKKNEIMFDEISIKDTITVTVGDRKIKGIKKIWTRPEPVVEVKSKNPYTQVADMANIVIEQEKPKWYQTGVARTAFGAVVGIIVGLSIR